MPGEVESLEIEMRDPGLPMRPRPPLRRREAELDPLRPTRSGRSLKHRAAAERTDNPIERRQERQQTAAIEALKARVEKQTALESQWKTTRDELEAQKQARTTEAARVAAQIALLESEVHAASFNAARTIEAVSRQRNRWRTTAIVAMMVALSSLCFVLSPLGGARPMVVRQVGLPELPAKPKVVHISLPEDPHAALTTALDRLNGAFETAPDRIPEQALRKVAGRDGCAIIWTNGLPSVVFAPLGSNSIAKTLAHCAEAVEGLR